MLWGDRGTNSTRSWWFGFRHGFVCGWAFFLTSLFWIKEVSLPGAFALTFYLALYPAVWATLVVKFAAKANLKNALLVATWWAGLEWLRGLLLTGFGWHQLGVILHRLSWLIQPAEWIGTAGLSLPLMFVSAALFYGLWERRWKPSGIAVVTTLMVWGGIGWLLEHQANAIPSKEIQVLLVQGNVSQQEKWEDQAKESMGAQLPEEVVKAAQDRIMSRYDQLHDFTKAAVESGPLDLVVWPESSLHYPFHSELNQSFLDTVSKMGNFTLTFGCDVTDPGVYNCLVALRGGYENAEIYRKVHLVAFGEYIPLRKELPFLESIAGDLIPYDFDAGTVTDPLVLKGDSVEIIPSVCFEDTVPRHMRKFITDHPQIIVNVANDAWFNETAQQEQHFWNARLRAVELRRPTVRSANTGVSFALSSTGALLGRMDKYQADTLRVTVPVPQEGKITLYARWGDWFSVLVGSLGLLYGIITSRSGGR